MKTKITFTWRTPLLLLAFIFANYIAIADYKEKCLPLDVKLERIENTMRFKLKIFNAVESKKIKISIKNNFKEEILTEWINEEGLIERVYDFTTMEPGDYVLEILRGNEKIKNSFSNYTINDGKSVFNVVFISNKAERIYSVLIYTQAKDKVRLSLYNNKMEALFGQVIKEQEQYGNNYNLSKLKPGNYILEVTRKDKKFTKLITIE